MKMPKDRKLDRRQSLQRFAQIDAADIFSREDPVEKAMRRSVRDQDLRVRRNQIPVRLDFGPALAIERPVIEPRLDRAAPKFAPADRGATVVEIDDRRRMGLEERDGGGRFSLEKKVVVTGDQNLVFVWLGFQPLEKFCHLLGRSPVRAIARMDEDVAGRERDAGVTAMGVGNTNDTGHDGLSKNATYSWGLRAKISWSNPSTKVAGGKLDRFPSDPPGIELGQRRA